MRFKNVTKHYPVYSSVTAGFKYFILNFPRSLRETMSWYTVFEDISFEIYQGECFGVIGRNGAGKSTLLSLIAGVIKPDAGFVEVNGKVLPFLELGSGFHPDLTGRENIIVNGILMGLTKEEIVAQIENIVRFSELGPFIDRPLRTYSSGMMARLGFSILVHIPGDIVLIDEVLAVGDMAFQRKCFDKISEFIESGKTVVIVSHSMDWIERLCKRALWLENKGIKMCDDAKVVCSAYREAML